MAGSKCGKYIVTEPLEIPKDIEDVRERRHAESNYSIAYADGKIIQGASMSTGGFWKLPLPETACAQGASMSTGGFWKLPLYEISDIGIKEAHTHPFDEVLAYFGSNPEDPHDLGGEIELWLEDEKFLMSKSFIAYIPAGMRHGPLILRRIDRPIFHYVVANTGTELDLFQKQGSRDSLGDRRDE